MMPLFLLIFEILQCIQYIYSITFIRRHIMSFLCISPSLVSSVGKPPGGVPTRESNSGLPYSKPTHYQLSYIYLQIPLHNQFQADCLLDSQMIAISHRVKNLYKLLMATNLKNVNICIYRGSLGFAGASGEGLGRSKEG